MQEFYDEQKLKLKRQRERLIKQYPLWEVLSEFANTATQLNLNYQDFIDNPTGIRRRIVTLQLAKLTRCWESIVAAQLLEQKPQLDNKNT